MKAAAVVPLRLAGLEVAAVVTDQEGDGGPVTPGQASRSNVVPFDRGGAR